TLPAQKHGPMPAKTQGLFVEWQADRSKPILTALVFLNPRDRPKSCCDAKASKGEAEEMVASSRCTLNPLRPPDDVLGAKRLEVASSRCTLNPLRRARCPVSHPIAPCCIFAMHSKPIATGDSCSNAGQLCLLHLRD